MFVFGGDEGGWVVLCLIYRQHLLEGYHAMVLFGADCVHTIRRRIRYRLGTLSSELEAATNEWEVGLGYSRACCAIDFEVTQSAKVQVDTTGECSQSIDRDGAGRLSRLVHEGVPGVATWCLHLDNAKMFDQCLPSKQLKN